MQFLKSLFIILFFIGLSSLSCNSSRSSEKNTGKESTKVEKPDTPHALPPGQADIKAIIKEYSENENSIVAVVEISEVLRYGPATPPLAPGAEIKILIQRQIFNDQKDKFKKGESTLMRISYTQGVNNNNNWELKSFL